MAEDNLPDALVIQDIVDTEQLPFEFHLVRDGEEAIAFIARAEADPAAPRPHVLILDLNLPKKDGHAVLRRLRASTLKHVPVVIVTSSDDPADRRNTAELGAEFFRKPPSYDEFLKLGAVLRQVVERARQST